MEGKIVQSFFLNILIFNNEITTVSEAILETLIKYLKQQMNAGFIKQAFGEPPFAQYLVQQS